MQAIREQLLRYFQLDKKVACAKGGILWMEDGNKVYDFLSQYGANPLGSNDNFLLRGITEFTSEKQPMMCQPLHGSHVPQLKTRLLEMTQMPNGDVSLCQSGAEAVEIAIKMVRAQTQKKYTIALDHSFHGKTTAAVQLTANPDYRECFGIENTFVRRLSTDVERDLEADFAGLIADNKVNAIILELVQGEGGMRPLDKAWVQRLAELARKSGVLIIADEVQTGLGRTGSWFAFEQYDIKPDIVLVAKALGGGIVPIGACISAAGVCPSEFSLYHSSTFANNNFTCAIANRLLDRLQDGVIENAARMGVYLGNKLQSLVEAYPDVYEATAGLGLMRGITLQPQRDHRSYISNLFWNTGLSAYAAAGWLFRTQHILTMPCFSHPSCLRVQPPLISTRKHIDKGIAGLSELAGLLRSDVGATGLLDCELDSQSVDLACFGRFSAESKDDFAANDVMGSGRQPRQWHYVGPPPSVCRSRIEGKPRRFQFAIHPLHDKTCLDSLPFATDTLSCEDRERLSQRIVELASMTQGSSAECFTIEPFKLGENIVEGRLFALNLTASDIMNANARERKTALKSLANSAYEFNPDVFGLGAFTSIIAHGGFLLRELPHTITTGSSLTAYAAVQSALTSPAVTQPQHYAVIGANGGVGSLCWQLLLAAAADCADVGSLSLFYNPKNKNAIREIANTLKRATADWRQRLGTHADAELLRDVASVFRLYVGSLKESSPEQVVSAFTRAVDKTLGDGFLHICATDDYRQMCRPDRVLVATNRVDGVEELHFTKKGAFLYDIGYPMSFDPAVMATEGKSSYSAGLVRSPGPWEFGRSNIANIPVGKSLGCFAETMTLAATDPTAAPRGAVIKLDEALRVGELAISIGFEPTVVIAEVDAATNDLSSQYQAVF